VSFAVRFYLIWKQANPDIGRNGPNPERPGNINDSHQRLLVGNARHVYRTIGPSTRALDPREMPAAVEGTTSNDAVGVKLRAAQNAGDQDIAPSEPMIVEAQGHLHRRSRKILRKNRRQQASMSPDQSTIPNQLLGLVIDAKHHIGT